MKTEKKNIRIFSQDGLRDLTNEAPVSLNRHCAWYCLLDAQAEDTVLAGASGGVLFRRQTSGKHGRLKTRF